ncbi:MAG: ABC transporter permease, partial [Haliscomenobacter sp.]
MNKLWLIVQREYLSRVTRKSFILATLLTPLGFAAFIVIVSVIFGYESDDSKEVAVIDPSGILQKALRDEKNLFFRFVEGDLTEIKKQVADHTYDAALELPPIGDV